jgi:nicotinate dehydrogenase subunit B
MRQGISRDGANLYPAFPYTAFARISDEDLYALYAYLQTLLPVRAETPRAQMAAPLNLRPAVAGWNLMFHRPAVATEPATPAAATTPPDPARVEEWERGRYLVEGAGHCSACHSPRNALGAEATGADRYAGAMVDGWYAPPLAGPAAAARGWTEDSLFAYLRAGLAEPAAASGPMAEVVASLAPLPEADLRAMALYLISLAPAAQPLAAVAEAAVPPGRAQRVFEAACAACHDPAVPGMATAAHQPLGRSAVLRAPTPEAFETLLDHGLTAPLGTGLRDMPAFRGELSASDRGELAAWLRARFAPDLPAW